MGSNQLSIVDEHWNQGEYGNSPIEFYLHYISFDSMKFYWIEHYHSQSCRLNLVTWLFLFTPWVDSNFNKITQKCSSMLFLWMRTIFYQITWTMIQWRSWVEVYYSCWEMHVSTLRALIHLYSLIGFVIITMNSSTSMSFYILFAILKQQFVLLDD
jgi:hypothetical protein